MQEHRVEAVDWHVQQRRPSEDDVRSHEQRELRAAQESREGEAVRTVTFSFFVQLFEKYGTLIERNTALIEKVSPCRCGIYHNMELSLQWLESQRAVMDGEHVAAGWFLRYPNGSVFDKKQHVQQSRVNMSQWIIDWRNQVSSVELETDESCDFPHVCPRTPRITSSRRF
eukprot:SAG31_NODE_4750_length_2980_cov_1.358209_1_plen_170_part_00